MVLMCVRVRAIIGLGWSQAAHKVGVELSHSEVADLFAIVDSNASGQVSYKEFKKWLDTQSHVTDAQIQSGLAGQNVSIAFPGAEANDFQVALAARVPRALCVRVCAALVFNVSVFVLLLGVLQIRRDIRAAMQAYATETSGMSGRRALSEPLPKRLLAVFMRKSRPGYAVLVPLRSAVPAPLTCLTNSRHQLRQQRCKHGHVPGTVASPAGAACKG